MNFQKNNTVAVLTLARSPMVSSSQEAMKPQGMEVMRNTRDSQLTLMGSTPKYLHVMSVTGENMIQICEVFTHKICHVMSCQSQA